jgi:hypothetical protein
MPKSAKYCSVKSFIRANMPKLWEAIEGQLCMEGAFAGRGGLTFLVPDAKYLAEIIAKANDDSAVAIPMLRNLLIKMNLPSANEFKQYQDNIPNANRKKLVVKSVGQSQIDVDGAVIVPHKDWTPTSANQSQSVWLLKSGVPKADTPEAVDVMWKDGEYVMYDRRTKKTTKYGPVKGGAMFTNDYFSEPMRDALMANVGDRGMYVATLKSATHAITGGSNDLVSYLGTGNNTYLDSFNGAAHGDQINMISGLAALMYPTPAAAASAIGGSLDASDLQMSPGALAEFYSPSHAASLTEAARSAWGGAFAEVDPTAIAYEDSISAFGGMYTGNEVLDNTFQAINGVAGGADIIIDTATVGAVETSMADTSFPTSAILKATLSNIVGGKKRGNKTKRSRKGKTGGGLLGTNFSDMAQLAAISSHPPSFSLLGSML